MGLRAVALEHYRSRARLARAMESAAARLWGRVDRGRIADSWAALVPALLALLVGAQRAAAGQADEYVAAALAEQGLSQEAVGRVNVDALVGIASDGRPLDTLLYQPAITVLTGIAAGHVVPRAMAAGQVALQMIVATQVADAGRVADQVALTAHRRASGYVRMLVGDSCSRCVILAGRWYAYNAGFDRHPRCDCIHVPAREDTGDSIRTNPRTYFNSLSREEQDRVFTRAGAQAIRLGADISQVVNARRGAYGLTPAGARLTAEEARAVRGGRRLGRLTAVDVFGRQLYVTTEGTRRGLAARRLRPGAPRLMPESILQLAGDDRDEAIRLLRYHGYII